MPILPWLFGKLSSATMKQAAVYLAKDLIKAGIENATVALMKEGITGAINSQVGPQGKKTMGPQLPDTGFALKEDPAIERIRFAQTAPMATIAAITAFEAKANALIREVEQAVDQPNEGLACATVMDVIFDIYDSFELPGVHLVDCLAAQVRPIKERIQQLWYETCCNTNEDWKGGVKDMLHNVNIAVGVAEAWVLVVSNESWGKMMAPLKTRAVRDTMKYRARQSRKQKRALEVQREQAELNKMLRIAGR